MCAALPAVGALGSGATTALFAAGLGLTALNAFSQRAAARDAARQTYQQALIAQRSAERDKRLQQEALSERQAEERKSKAQDIFAKNIQALQSKRAIVASERAGTTIGLLLMDQERQAANYRESINQSLESARRQYDRNILATEAQFESRRNQLQSNVNEAYNQIPSLGQTLLSIASSGLQSYIGLQGLASPTPVLQSYIA